jgi:hypothetical protein
MTFATMGVPGITNYMSTKYGSQWVEYTKRVPSAIFPGLYSKLKSGSAFMTAGHVSHIGARVAQ